MAQILPISEHSATTEATIRTIDISQPRKWIVAGWHDLTVAPAISLMYGATFSVIGILMISALLDSPHLVLGLTTGFLLLAPFLAAGFYNISRHIEKGDKITLRHAVEIWHTRPQSLAMFAALLGIIMVGWVRLASIMFALSFNGSVVMTQETFLASLLFSADGLTFLALFFTVGAGVAAFTFAISAIAIPMIMDKDTDCITAAITSFQAVMKNKVPMALWAALIVGYTFLGLITFCVGLIITMPLIGHATWHAYRALVEKT